MTEKPKTLAEMGVVMEKMKIDLILWTHNSEKTLPKVLQRINEVVPSQYVNRKISMLKALCLDM